MLGFFDGTNSTLLESKLAATEQLKVIEVDPSKNVNAISMLLSKGRNIKGLRLYDE